MRWFLLAAVVAALFWGASLALRPAPLDEGRVNLTVWGMSLSEENQGFTAQIRGFEKRHPGIKVTVLSMGAGGMNPQKLLTAIVGKTSPDMVLQDRFTIGDWASRGAFMPLDDLIARDRREPDCPRPEDFYDATWQEAVYQGKVYAIPSGVDNRALFWNREVFREAAPKLRAAGLDPNRPPRTWSELKAYAVALTEYKPDGSYKRVGFLPLFGNSWLYLYSWQMNGEFMSEDGTRSTLHNQRTRAALDYMVDIYDTLGGMDKIDAFVSGFQAKELDPFITGKIAMKIDGSWVVGSIAQYDPTLDFAVAPAPVPDDRYYKRGIFKDEEETYITWSGGFSYAIPVGSKHVNEAWEFIKWMTSTDSALIDAKYQGEYLAGRGRIYVMGFRAKRSTTEALYEATKPDSPVLANAIKGFIDLLPHSRFRPVTHVGQTLWDEHQRAFEQAAYHKMSSDAALAQGQEAVQRELDRLAARQRHPAIPAGVLIGLGAAVAAAALVGLGYLWRATRGLGRLGRSEALAGYGFISPWAIGFFVFTAGPILASLFLSFCHYDVLHPARWVGLGNYVELLTTDWGKFGKSIYNVGYLAVLGVPLNLVTGLAIAMLLNTGVRGMRFYRTAFYIPSIAPIIAAAVLWAWVLSGDPDKGLLNSGLRWIWPGGLPGWLGSEAWSKPALIVMGLWGAGGGMILWLAGLQGVPKQLYEAARIDGATSWQSFRHITLPQITPYLFFNMVMGTIGALQEFERVYVMRPADQVGIGPVDSLLVPVFYLFDNGFKYFRMGYASAMAWALFAAVLILTLVQLKLAPRWVYYEGGEAGR
jgi:ABC-type sugar transport system permease subunit/ABC-type glycerol-3-phosphate transport system substrate-binding protein